MQEEKKFKNFFIYGAIFITGLLTSNILGSKIVIVFGLQMPSATVAYALTYLMTDVVGELYGKKYANFLVKIGFICLFISSALIKFAIILPSNNDTAAFNSVFNSTLRIILGSFSGYLVSQTLDVYIFHKIKNFSTKYKFIRNNVSTIISQFFDTVIFSFVGFYGIVPQISSLIYGVFLAKVTIALLDTPFFYWLTYNQAGQKDFTDEKQND